MKRFFFALNSDKDIESVVSLCHFFQTVEAIPPHLQTPLVHHLSRTLYALSLSIYNRLRLILEDHASPRLNLSHVSAESFLCLATVFLLLLHPCRPFFASPSSWHNVLQPHPPVFHSGGDHHECDPGSKGEVFLWHDVQS